MERADRIIQVFLLVGIPFVVFVTGLGTLLGSRAIFFFFAALVVDISTYFFASLARRHTRQDNLIQHALEQSITTTLQAIKKNSGSATDIIVTAVSDAKRTTRGSMSPHKRAELVRMVFIIVWSILILLAFVPYGLLGSLGFSLKLFCGILAYAAIIGALFHDALPDSIDKYLATKSSSLPPWVNHVLELILVQPMYQRHVFRKVVPIAIIASYCIDKLSSQ